MAADRAADRVTIYTAALENESYLSFDFSVPTDLIPDADASMSASSPSSTSSKLVLNGNTRKRR